ncbi:MAG: glycosyltransferase [Bacillota bacterium]
MKKTKIIIVDILFNAWKRSSQIYDKDWIENRMKIFMDYTLNSLKGQSNQSFIALVRYDRSTVKLIKQALSKYPSLPSNIKFIEANVYNKELIELIKSTRGYDHLYIVRLDSDDLYNKSFIQKLHDYNHKTEKQVLISRNGYIYDSVNHRIAKYYHKSPPYHALVYRVKDFIGGKRHRLPKGHWSALELNYELLGGTNFISHVHSNNTLFSFKKNYTVGPIITDRGEIRSILEGFM